MHDIELAPDLRDLEHRRQELEQRQQQQSRLLMFCVAGLLAVLLLNMIPGLGGVLSAISFSLAGLFIVLLLFLMTRGLLERSSPSDPNPAPRQKVD